MKPLVYVAGPITGDPWGCVRKATVAAAILEDLGCWAYLPQMSVLHEIVSPMPYEHWIGHGLAMVERCDGLWRLSGESPGADREVQRAVELGCRCSSTGQIRSCGGPRCRCEQRSGRERVASTHQ